MAAGTVISVSNARVAALEHLQITEDTLALYFQGRRDVKEIFAAGRDEILPDN
jgi:hypothetical protein